MVTSPDSGWVRTHDDAAGLLRSLAPGAKVTISRSPVARERGRIYAIELPAQGRHRVVVTGAYSLPCVESQLAAHTRKQLDEHTGRLGAMGECRLGSRGAPDEKNE